MNDYSTRGLFSLVFGVVAAIAAVSAIVRCESITVIGPAGFCVAAFVKFFRCRGMTQKQWEKKHSHWDERDNAIEGRTASFTLKLCATVLFAGGYFFFLTDWKIQLFIDAVLLFGVLTYVIAGSYYEKRM